ncbi:MULTISPECIES: hydrogenase [unclassified Hyphomicrobium]|uniref:hydrogenase n=1 Tax=unclassified Hyphomicrobium TaxID=2619925 RepID=UPI0002FF0CC5|nr:MULTISPECIES: hydrogenase [unclassified Hyphomicrobium]
MSKVLKRLTEDLGYPILDETTLECFLAEPGERVLFLTGDPATNLETDDVAAILPELVQAFQHRFQAAVVDRSIEQPLRERYEVWPVPSLIFLCDGEMTGAIPKVRDWTDYLAEIKTILDRPATSVRQ